jgi:hypothetical protein
MQNAEFLLPNAGLARQVPTLTTGQAVYWSDAPPVTIAVPLADDAILRAAAGGKPPQPYQPGEKVHLLRRPAPAPVAAPTPARPASLDDRIIELLRHSADPLDGNAVAAQLAADLQQVRNALTRLYQSRQLARSGTARNYRYTTADNHTTNGDAAPSG